MTMLKDSVISMMGVVAGQISLFFCVSLIGRFQGPAVLGHFNYLLACGTFVGTLLAFRYELACVSDSPRYSFNAFIHVTLLSVVVVIVAVCVTLAMSHVEVLAVEACAFAYFTQQAAGAYLSSLRRYDIIAASRLAINGVFLLSLLAEECFGTLDRTDAFGMYCVINVMVASALLVGILLHGRHRDYRAQVAFSFFSENSRFAAFILPSTLCGSVMTYSLAITIPHWFGAESAGYFAAAYRLGFFPVSLTAQSVGSVFRRDLIGALARENAATLLHQVFMTYARYLAVIALVYAAGGALLFAPLVRIFLGARWHGASAFFYEMIPLFAVQLMYMPLSQVFLATRGQRIDFLFQLGCGVVLSATLFTVHLMRLSVLPSIRAFSVAGVTMMLVGLMLTVQVVKRAAAPSPVSA
ncbi:oligosaccharide flippase family protein [Paraburkholderia phymatum]|nr:oligosaccharide flippase family protein [Paraburkholderia phymatum]